MGDITFVTGEGRMWGRSKTKYRGGVERENEIALCEIFNKPENEIEKKEEEEGAGSPSRAPSPS